MPRRFEVSASGGPLPYEVRIAVVTDGGRAVADRMEVRRRPTHFVPAPRDVPGREPVTTAGLRHVPVGRIIEQAARLQAQALTDTPDTQGFYVTWATAAEMDAAGQVANPRRPGRPRGRGGLTDEDLAPVVAAWRATERLTRRRELTAQAVGRSRSQVVRMLNQAVQRGLLRRDEVPRRETNRT